ncbi:hypothetical protein Tco_0115381 [Tanacetum coccineum]
MFEAKHVQVPSADIVNISSTNIRLETIVPQKEETIQVMINVIKNFTCFKAFTIFADVLEFFMQQFWYTIKKILDICPRVNVEEFSELQNNDDTLTFLLDLGYKDSPKKSRGKGSQGKNTVHDSQETVDVSEESEPEPIKKKTANRIVVKKKVTLSDNDNIIPDDPDIALELGKSISLTEAEEAEATRKVHATHARIVTESAKKKSGGRSSRGVAIQDTPIAPKPKPATLKPKLKGAQSLTLAEKEAANIMQALKKSKKTSKIQPGTGGSSEGTSTIPGVLDKSTVVFATSSEGTGSGQESEYSKEDQLDDEENDDKDGDADDVGDDHISDTQDAETKSDVDELYKYKIHVHKDVDARWQKLKLLGMRIKKRIFSVSSGFGTQFFNSSSDISLTGVLKDTAEADVSSLMDIQIQQETPQFQSPSLRVAKLEKDMSELKKIDLSAKALAALKTQVPYIVDNFLGSKVGDVFQKELKKHMAYLIQKYSLQQIPKLPKNQTPTVDLEQESEKSPSEILKIKKQQAEKQKTLKFTIKSTDKAALKEFDQKSALYQTMHANKSFNRNPANHRLYHALMEALIEDENAMDKGVADTIKGHKRKHNDDEDDDDEDPPSRLNQSKKTKRKRTKESESSKNPSTTKETPKGEYVVCDDDQPQDTSEPKTAKTLNPKWFTQPPRPPTPNPKWNKRQVVLDQPEQPWFNQMVFVTKDPLTFNDLMATLIDFSKHAFWQRHPGHLTIAADYFFNNDLEYLKSSDPERMYTTSITKTKAALYEIEGIEDMGEGRKLWQRSQLKKFSKHNEYSIKVTLGVKSVSVKKLYECGYLEEIVVKRVDHQFYKFKEGDLVDLHLNVIEDMLLLTVQHNLFHLINNDIVDFIVALRMFTRSLVIKKRVEDL